ncbi:MAG: SPFH domain-containing protein [Chloroflexales bacterium]
MSAVIATTFVQDDPLPLFLLLFLIGLPLWLFSLGGGWRVVDKDTVVIRKDLAGNIQPFYRGSYLYMPIVHTIEAKMPSYPLRHEFPIASIDTRTPGLLQINQIRVRVIYEISDFRTYFDRSADVKERIKDLEDNVKLSRDDPSLWRKVTNEVMYQVIDDAVRDGVWKWAEHVAEDAALQLDVPFEKKPNPEYDPYALSLNREKLAKKIREEVQFLTESWGLCVHSLVFENITIDDGLIRRKTRNKARELENAEHDARKEAIAIRLRGFAEAEVRAETVARVIGVLLNQREKGVALSEQTLYDIVRAAMYSDGEMIWHATMEKGPGPNASVKAA